MSGAGAAPGYVARRVGQAALVVALSYVLVYVVLFVLPGDPVRNAIDNPQNPIPKSEATSLLHYYNLDKPVLIQFIITVGRLLHGDLGYSLTSGTPVSVIVGQGIGQTVSLAALALVISIALALVVSVTAVYSPVRIVRELFQSLPPLFLSVPSFLVGLVLLQLFSYQLGWFSAIRDQGFNSLILPAVTLAIAVNAPISQVLIQGLARTAREPFIVVLRAKGLSGGRILSRHVLKNGSIPALTLLGLSVGELLAGSVVTETIFNRTGIGYVTQQAVRNQDTPVILTVVILVSAIFVAVNLAADLLYPLIDRRILLAPGAQNA